MTVRPGEAGAESLAGWCVATGVAALGFMVYLPLGALPSLAGFTEEPWALTIGMAVCGVLSVHGAWHRRLAVTRIIRRTLFFGAFLAFMGNVNYAHYVYFYSHSVPDAEGAPQVGQPAPEFTIPDPSGGTWSLSAFQGTPFLLVFYRAHW